MIEDDMETRALERLVASLTDEEYAGDRATAVAHALAMAQIALWGESNYSEEQIQQNLDDLAIQLMVGRLDREGVSTHMSEVSWEGDEDGEVTQIIATSNPIISSIINHTVDRYLKPTGQFDLN